MEKCKEYKVARAEILNIISIRPSSLVEINWGLTCELTYLGCYTLYTHPNGGYGI
ncbi:hypothetical protein Leryth_024909 [Lithospermum erythrorhizon]|nr:hypothetical protein Leryth_024909 [Lithospermum erythrorhizon]